MRAGEPFVFVPPNGGPRVVYGQDESGALVHIEDAERGKSCGLMCPDCGGQLIANKGEIKQPYFSHASLEECAHAGETALHRLAKEIISEKGSLRLPRVVVYHYDEDTDDEVLHEEQKRSFTRVEVEPRQDGFQPDLIGIIETWENGRVVEHRLHIEILVTHAVDGEKLARLRKNGESALEIDLSKVRRAIGKTELASLLLGDARRRWLYHKVAFQKQEKVNEKRRQVYNKFLRDQERKKAFAEMKRQEREDELNWPPAGAGKALLEHTQKRMAFWRLLDLGWAFDFEADDRYFDVEPEVWRLQVLDIISPWNKHADTWTEFAAKAVDPAYEGLRIAHGVSASLRKAGLVKTAYHKDDIIDYIKGLGKQHRSPIANQVNRMLRRIARGPDGSSEVETPFSLKAWRGRAAAAQALLNVYLLEVEGTARCLEEWDVDLLYKDGVVRSKEDMRNALLLASEDHPIWNRKWWGADGAPIAGIPLFHHTIDNHHREDGITGLPYEEIRRSGFSIRLSGDSDPGCEERALMRLAHPYFGAS